MSNFIPLNFIEALAGLVISLALILSLISLIPALRSHSLRLLALFFVAALSLFSNHWLTYFAGIFVIATAVTELEFLQNLAAIIRGNKDYFDYKKESLTSDQKQKKIETEQNQLNQPDTEEPDEKSKTIKTYRATVTGHRQNIEKLLEIEEKALDKMEEYYDSKMERGIRISRKGKHIALDGLIPSIADDMVMEKIIEVKYLSDSKNFATIKNIFPQLENIANTYCEITNKMAKLHIVLVVEGEEGLNERQLSTLKKLVDSSNIAMGYTVYTTKQLGIQ